MSDLTRETVFFHDISSQVMKFVSQRGSRMIIARDKAPGDYATEVDIAVEQLIVQNIQKLFPGDLILAEEGYSEVEIPDTRIWIIDPICGTGNLGKGLSSFCTNIALADKGQLIASCVIDHSHNEYFWSVGDNKVYVNNKPYQPVDAALGTKIDVDYGCVRDASKELQRKHGVSVNKLLDETSYDIISLNTSLGFAYTAIGKVDGFINLFTHPWDISASSFLIQQAGGIITGLEGEPWTLSTLSAIAARNPEIHQTLLTAFLNS